MSKDSLEFIEIGVLTIFWLMMLLLAIVVVLFVKWVMDLNKAEKMHNEMYDEIY